MTLFFRQLCVLSACLILTGSAHAAVSVDLEGVSGAELDNVNAYLSISKVAKRPRKDAVAISDFAISRMHGKAEAEIHEALMPFGYYSPKVTGSLTQKGDDWVARYVIEKGPATTITQVDIKTDETAAANKKVQALLSRTKVKKGLVLNHQDYTQLKQDLLRTVVSAGYLEAGYQRAEIRVEPDKQQASVHLDLKSGPLYVFGPVTLEQEALDQAFAERYITLKRGEPFSSSRLVAMQFALSDSGYYQNVSVVAPREGAVNFEIPVQVKALSRKAQRYVARVGAGTDTGPRVSLGSELRRLSSRGAKLRSDIQLSAVKSTATAQYSIPIKNVATDRQTFSGSFDRAEIGDTDSDLVSVGGRRYDRWKGLGRQLYLEFENELFSIRNQTDARSELLIVGASLAYQKVDDAIFTRRGLTARLDIHGSQEGLLSDTSFVQATLTSRAIYPLGSKSRLLLRADVGVTEVDRLSSLPPSQRFFTGGDRTIRGYGYEELAPQNAEGLKVGGRYLLAASVEADHFFNDKYGVAVFFDHGNAVNSLSDTLKSGFGIGFRYRTPIGVLRIDAARPVDKTEDTFRLHLSLGPDS